MSTFARLFENDVGIDLGTANARVWARGTGLVMDEPSAVAVDARSRKPLAFGKKAEDLVGGKSGGAVLVRPVEAGCVRDEALARAFLKHCFRKVPWSLLAPRAVLAVPGDLDQDRKVAIKNAATGAGAREVFLIEAPMAAAIGAGLRVTEPTGCAVVDIGAATANAAVISLAGIVCARDVRIGADVAERDPEAFEAEVVGCAARLLGMAPPEIAADLVDSGIVLTGGGALRPGLAERMSDVVRIPVRVADDPTLAVVRGIAHVLDQLRWLRRAAVPAR